MIDAAHTNDTGDAARDRAPGGLFAGAAVPAARGANARPLFMVAGCVVLCAALVAAVVWTPSRGAQPSERSAAEQAAVARRGDVAMSMQMPMSASGRAEPTASGAAEAIGPSESPGAAVDRLWTTGSLRGAELDGDWGRWAGGLLQPGFSLRRRFDQLLSTQGEATPAQLRPWIEQRVAAEHGPAGAQQVLAVWDAYVALQQRPKQQAIDLRDAARWESVLSEHSLLRRQLLGSAWADAFYADEERALRAFAERRMAQQQARGAAATQGAGAVVSAAQDAVDAEETGVLLSPAPDRLTPDQQAGLQVQRAAQFGAEAAERLQAEDAAWAAWDRRIADARAQWRTIEQAAELSAPQRRQAQERLLTERFAADELSRAAALVGGGS